MFDIFVKSRSSIEEVNTNKQFSLISIIEPLDKRTTNDSEHNAHLSFPAMAANKANCVSSLCLRFYDVDKVVEVESGLILYPISNLQTRIINNFVKEAYEENIEELYVNCAAGISRSAGVAAAISKFYTGKDQYFYDNYLPNRYVYMRVLEALHECS